MRTLAVAFDPRANTLNAVRLVLASAVIYRHAQVTTSGTMESSVWNSQLFGQLPVDGFFAVSGFLMARSWLRNPDVRSYLISRFARIYPAFWVCLLVTAFVAAPLAMWLEGGSWAATLTASDGPIAYVGRNASLVILQDGIAGTPTNVPWVGDWNGSLWTLKWEFLCYLGVLAAGVTGMLASRRKCLAVFIVLLCASAAAAGAGLDVGVVDDFTRMTLMYVSGVLVYVYADRVPVDAGLTIAAGIVVMAAVTLTPEYRLIAALPLAYFLVTFGVLTDWKAARLPNDISYGMYIYGFPIEQLLAHTLLVERSAAEFAAVATLSTIPLAVLSWFLVEKPVLALARSHKTRPVRSPAMS